MEEIYFTEILYPLLGIIIVVLLLWQKIKNDI